MKKLYHQNYSLIIVFLIGMIQSSIAQTNVFPATGTVGIGTISPKASALLELKSTTQGLLIPRMTLAQRNLIISPDTGLIIFQTNSTPGLYSFSGSA